MNSALNILIDGPSRSGKLLLAKLLLSSSKLAFQHYSGDLERILELIYFSRNDINVINAFKELLRINLVHTIEDLRNARQLSVNKRDSSYYKKSAFYTSNHLSFKDGCIADEISLGNYGFILHTHESELFLNYAKSSNLLYPVLLQFIHSQISIIRILLRKPCPGSRVNIPTHGTAVINLHLLFSIKVTMTLPPLRRLVSILSPGTLTNV